MCVPVGDLFILAYVFIYKCLFNMREKQWMCEKGGKKI